MTLLGDQSTYRIKDWNRNFENHDSRRITYARWVPFPNKHDGKSYRRLMARPDGICIFGAWVLIVEVASKMPNRGVLADHDGPLTAEDLCAKTGAPAEIFVDALKALSDPKIGWLTDEPLESFPQAAALEGKDRTEQGKTEQKKAAPRQPLPRRTTPELDPPFTGDAFIQSLATYKASRTRALKIESELLLYDDLRAWGESESIIALTGAAKAGHLQVLHPDKYRNGHNGNARIPRALPAGVSTDLRPGKNE